MITTFARRMLVQTRVSLMKRNLSSDHHGVPDGYKHLVQPNMNKGYPLPNLTYNEAYAARQAKANAYLGGSILLFLSAVGYVYVSDTFGFLSPPPREVKIALE